jgi:S-DNA-T family DNA segregation ATPase FtsK/SpoIIIE
MTPDARRRLIALAAFAVGCFVLLTVLRADVTGPYGRALGDGLWHAFGIGALCLPLAGFAAAWAGLGRLGSLDMRRAGVLLAGAALVLPYFIGVLGSVTAGQLDVPVSDRVLAAKLTGVLPGFFASALRGRIGVAGALLAGLVGASGITIVTLGWHPLRWLERTLGVAEPAPEMPAVRAREREEDEALGRRPRAEALLERAAATIRGDADADASVETASAEPSAEAAARVRPAKPKLARAKGPTAQDVRDAETDLPPIDLLDAPPPQDTDAGEAQLDRLGQGLLETLRTFKVEGTIAGRTTGPVVTQFEVVPAPGVKAQRIVALADDLAITMRAPSIRVAPIPGKGAVGVEVPNPKARMVTLRELFETREWDESTATLPVALGRDLEGRPVVADLAKMPHLLIAGATGAGKSVAINTIISSLVYRYTPQELRLLLVDPKMVELSMYNALPHLRHKVVTDNKDAAAVLKWAVYEMNRRYELLQHNGARNLADFNAKVASGKPLRNPPRAPVTLSTISAQAETTPPDAPDADAYSEGLLPFVVVVIDELADLMMTVQGEVETPLAMLAQKARAIGIHLILATQRPSVNVITGLIKANFPSRIAFRVASKVDSRTILDQNGAEALLGNGDMLFLPPGRNEPMRLQGAYIATAETERVMDWFEARREARLAALAAGGAPPTDAAEPDILAVIRAQEAEASGEGGAGDADSGDRDPLFRDAAEACIQNQGGSTSLLQRRLRIGYGRAARIIDQLHFAGILGPPDGSKPREVLIGIEQLDEYAR